MSDRVEKMDTGNSMDAAGLEALTTDVVERGLQLGASQVEVGASLDIGLSVTTRMREVETLEYQRDRGLGVTVYFGHRKGSASSSDLDANALSETLNKACSIARYTAEDEFSGLADAERMARDIPDLDLFHPWQSTPEQAIDIAVECESTALDADPRLNNSEGATLATHEGVRTYANSHGFVGSRRSTSYSLSCVVIGEDAGGMERDYWYSTARRAEDLQSAAEVGLIAAQRTLARLGSRKLDTCQAPVMFPGDLARGLIRQFVQAIRGSSQYRKASFLLGASGEQLFPEFVNIMERPRKPRALGSAAFDNEGVETCDRELVTSGRLDGYVLNSYGARKLGLTTTGNAGGVRNLIVAPGKADRDTLIRDMNRGLLVSELIGHGINMVTGDYSRGAAGFWIENGEIAYPVSEITIAGNLRDIYRNIVAIGSDMDERGSICSGSIVIGNMTIAGQ